MALGVELGLSPGDFVLDGTQPPSPKRGRSLSPQFSVHFYCAQTDGCIEMPLGMEVGLSPGDTVFAVDPATLRKKAHPHPPNFWPMSIVAQWLDG